MGIQELDSGDSAAALVSVSTEGGTGQMEESCTSKSLGLGTNSLGTGATSPCTHVVTLYRSTPSARKLFMWVGITDFPFPVLTGTPEQAVSACMTERLPAR